MTKRVELHLPFLLLFLLLLSNVFIGHESDKSTNVTVIKLRPSVSGKFYYITHRQRVSLKVFRSSEIKDGEDGFTDLKISLFHPTNKLHLISFFVVGEVKLLWVISSKGIVSVLDVFDLVNLKYNHSSPLSVRLKLRASDRPRVG